MRYIFAACLLAILAAGCDVADNLLHPSIPDRAERYNPPAVYHDWWADLHRDVGHSGPPRILDVRWYKVPGDYWVTRRGIEARATWVPGGRIYIAEPYILCDAVVKHEMLHHYLNGDSDHKHPLFATDAYSGICPSDYE